MTKVTLDSSGMPTKAKTEPDNQDGEVKGSFAEFLSEKEAWTRKTQLPEEGGKLVWVPKSVLPYIRSTLDWTGAVVVYSRKYGSQRGRCRGHVLDVRLTSNGNTQMLVNCHEHPKHKPAWKHSRFIDDWTK